MMQEAIKQIEKYLAELNSVPVLDAAGIITPAGNENNYRAQGVEECLKILRRSQKELGNDD